MGRPRKPTAQHELNGSFDKHPERKAERALEPKPDGPLGPPPDCFKSDDYTGKRMLILWNEIISEAPPGVLTMSDRKHVEMTTRLLFKIRHGNPRPGDFTALEKALGKMGMNPADRSKVSIVPNNSVPTNAPSQRKTFHDLANEDQKSRVN